MRALIIVVIVVLAVIYIGGALKVGGAPIFGHIDSILGTGVLMKIHYSTFWLLYRGERTAESGLTKTREDIDQFKKTPVGIDKEKKYKQLDDAAK